jgi:DNA-directed RNA polymerase specialized sigma subunit
MTRTASSGLPRERIPRSARKLSAIKEIILTVKARHNLTDWDLAESIGVHKDTIENAQEEVGNLEVVTLLNIAWTYGEEAIAPVRNLYLCAPVDHETTAEKRRRLIRELAALEDAQ